MVSWSDWASNLIANNLFSRMTGWCIAQIQLQIWAQTIFLLPEATTSPAELTKRFGQTMKHAGNKELILSPTLSSSKKYEFSYIYVNRDGNNSSSIIAQTVCFLLLLKCTLCGCFVEPSWPRSLLILHSYGISHDWWPKLIRTKTYKYKYRTNIPKTFISRGVIYHDDPSWSELKHTNTNTDKQTKFISTMMTSAQELQSQWPPSLT